MKQVGDIEIHLEYDINTGENVITEYVVTQEDVRVADEQELENRIAKMKAKMCELNEKLPPVSEEYLVNTKTPLSDDYQAIIDEKNHIRRRLFEMTGEECAKCIDTTKLSANDTTELFLRKVIFDLAKRIKTLENGGAN